jgi:hypothetical protein
MVPIYEDRYHWCKNGHILCCDSKISFPRTPSVRREKSGFGLQLALVVQFSGSLDGLKAGHLSDMPHDQIQTYSFEVPWHLASSKAPVLILNDIIFVHNRIV